MPGKVKVQILAGRNLPVMDKTNETSDAYVEVKLGGTTYKTDVCKKSLNPVWNSEWFKFEMDDEELQDEPLQIRIMDHDTYSANDAIGKVYVDLNPLLLSANSGSSMSGWIPIYDTMHGIRGEISLIVKVDYFCDFNRFRQSSCGVQFFGCPGVPHGYRLHIIHGFVEELVSNEDPEYHWMDKLRTPRASNEARQTVFAKLSGEVQRRIGLKALELGGNSVIGYRQCFDLEGESGVTVRGIGTAVTLIRFTQDVQSLISSAKEISQESLGLENTCCQNTSDPIPLYFCYSISPFSSKALNVFKQYPVKFSNIAVNGNELKSNRMSRLKLYSNSQGLSSFRPRLMLPPPTTRCFNRFQQRSQSSSAAMQDEKSLALNQFVMHHNNTELYLSTTTLTPSVTSDVQNDDSVFHDSANDFILSPCAFDSSGHVSPTFLVINHEHCSSTCLSCVAASSEYSVLCNGDLHSKCASQQGFLSTSPLCRRSPLPEDTPGSPVILTPNKLSQSPVKPNIPCVCRRSSDSELNVSTKGVGNTGSNGVNKILSKPTVQAENMEMLEYPFLSMTQFTTGFVIHLGGVVAAQSVKLLGRVNNPEELESRDAWWKEIRMEIRSHARALGCNVVLGYSEATSICDDICVLSASGTAAIVCMHHPDTDNIRKEFPFTTVMDKKESDRERSPQTNCFPGFGPGKSKHLNESEDSRNCACSICHIPYSESSIPFAVSLTRCSICKKSKVPDVLFTTISPPIGIPITGKGCLIQARVCKVKKEGKGEINAKEISDSLPFLQFELHRQLLNKLKMKGMNGLFDLRIQLSISAKMLIAIATATAVYLTALPPQQLPKISSGKNLDDINLHEMQKMIAEAVKRNCDFYNIIPSIIDYEHKVNVQEEIETESDDDDDDNERPDLDLTIGNKDVCVLEMDDSEDADIISLLIDPNAPEGFELVNSEFVPGIDNIVCNLQMFTRMCRTKLSSGSSLTSRQLSQYCDNVIQSLFFKLRKMIPCALCNLQFKVELPEDDEIQVTLLGMALGIKEKPSKTDFKSSNTESAYGNNHQTYTKIKVETKAADAFHDKYKYHLPVRERYGIDITPLSYIPGIVVERYLGKLNFFFIRESTSIKEFGGMSGFVQSFIADVMAIIRAHVAALGGNALLSYFLNEYVLLQNPHKNQGQCLINVGGDVVQVTNLQHLHEPLKISTNEELNTNLPIKILEGSPKELKKSPISRLFPLKRGLHKKSFHPLGFLTP